MHFGEKLGNSKQKNSMGILSSLTREQKEAVGLLQIGTFLEYFDLMLYVHMAVLLNELFFPKTDPHTAALLTAFAFCSTYILRPFGALIFGWIGDNIGRKTTVIITTVMMSVSCVIMANLPTYAQIGVAAAWILTVCRIIQGLSSMGEIIGAEIYITEITKPPTQYTATSFLSIASGLGTVFALGIANLVTHYDFNWRVAFWIGAGIAVVGSIARTRLRETPEFIEGTRKLKRKLEKRWKNEKREAVETINFEKHIHQEPISKKTFIACFLNYCGWPISFYLVFMYFNPFLKATYGYSSEDIISHNFFLSIFSLLVAIFGSFLSYKIHPLKILYCRGIFFLIFSVLFPLLMNITTTPFHVGILQACFLMTALSVSPAESVLIKNISTFKRFTVTSFVYATTRAVMYILTSFGLVYLTEWFGHYGLLFICIPVAIGFLYGVNHFIKLEKASGNFPEPSTIDKALATR